MYCFFFLFLFFLFFSFLFFFFFKFFQIFAIHISIFASPNPITTPGRAGVTAPDHIYISTLHTWVEYLPRYRYCTDPIAASTLRFVLLLDILFFFFFSPGVPRDLLFAPTHSCAFALLFVFR